MNNNVIVLEKYNKTQWLDEVPEFKRRFKLNKVEGQDGVYDLERITGELIQQGVPKNQKHMNNIEDNIEINRNVLMDLTDRVIYLEIQAAINDALLGMPNDNTYKEYFSNTDWVKINRGILDETDKCLMLNEYTSE